MVVVVCSVVRQRDTLVQVVLGEMRMDQGAYVIPQYE